MSIPHIGLPHFLTVSVLLFALGIYAVIARRGAVLLLIGVELMLAGAHLNLIAFARYNTVGISHALTGQAGAAVAIVLQVCEAAVALAIISNFFRRFATLNADEADVLRD